MATKQYNVSSFLSRDTMKRK